MRIIVVPVIFLAVTTLSTSFLTGFSPQPHVHYPPSSSSTTRSFLRDSVDPDRRWQQEQWLVYGYRPNKNGNTKTALCMGFRSFIKKRILRKNDGDEYETENDTVTDEQMDALIDEMSPEEFDILEDDDVDTDGEKSDGAAVADASSRSNEQDSRPSSSRNYESTKERIQRVKSGQMTEEEKAAFLNTAMTRINNPKKRKGPPIRQPIPVEGSGGSNKGTTSPASSPSPYPTDSLWSEIMGGRSSDDGNQKGGLTGYKSGQKLNENEKRRYFEMVTNPNRFKKNTPSSAGDGAKETTNTVPSPSVRNEKQETAPAAAPIEVEVPTKAEKKKEETTIANDLGTRLGAAAILKEKQDAENRRKMEQKRKEEEEQAKAAAAEVQRKLLEETRRQQEEAAAKKAAIEEARLKEEQKRKAAEEEQKKKLQAVQDEYWKKKFEEEKAKKENLITNEERAKAEEEKKKKAEIEQKRKMREAAEEKQRLMLKEEAKVREEKKAADNLTQLGKVSIQTSAPRSTISSPLKTNTFKQEQAQKKAARDTAIDEQVQRLKALNSPLPSPGGAQKSQIPIVTTRTPMPTPNLTPRTASTNVAKTDRLNLAELTMRKKDTADENGSAPPPPPVVSPSEPATFERLNLAELTRLKKDEPVKEESKVEEPQVKKKPIRQQIAPQTKRVVRQQLPLVTNVDDDDEDDDIYRSDGGKGMSIADAMKRTQSKKGGGAAKGGGADAEKEKAKMWGIDIDKFM